MKRLLPFLAAALASMPGCGMVKDEPASKDIAQTVQNAEVKALESRTLSSLAKLESSIAAYVEAEKKIPPNLEVLVPQYLAEIPMVELGIPRHHDSAAVKTYPSLILRDGGIDGSQLRDSGRWGYVHNDRQVVIFVDCTHRMTNGTPWYQARGVF